MDILNHKTAQSMSNLLKRAQYSSNRIFMQEKIQVVQDT